MSSVMIAKIAAAKTAAMMRTSSASSAITIMTIADVAKDAIVGQGLVRMPRSYPAFRGRRTLSGLVFGDGRRRGAIGSSVASPLGRLGPHRGALRAVNPRASSTCRATTIAAAPNQYHRSPHRTRRPIPDMGSGHRMHIHHLSPVPSDGFDAPENCCTPINFDIYPLLGLSQLQAPCEGNLHTRPSIHGPQAPGSRRPGSPRPGPLR